MSERIRQSNEFCIGGNPDCDPSENYRSRMLQRKEDGEFDVDFILNSDRNPQYDLIDELPEGFEGGDIDNDPFDPRNA